MEVCGNLLDPWHLPRWADSFLSICFASVKKHQGCGTAWGSWGLLAVLRIAISVSTCYTPALGFPTHFFHKFLVCLALLSGPVDAYDDSLVRICQKIAVDTTLPWYPSNLSNLHTQLSREIVLLVVHGFNIHTSRRPPNHLANDFVNALVDFGQPRGKVFTTAFCRHLANLKHQQTWRPTVPLYLWSAKMIRPGQATQKCGLNLLHHVRIARTERQKFMAVALLFGHLQIPPCMEFYASLHIADTTCRYLYELFIRSTSAMNQAIDSSRTKNKAHPFRSLQTIAQKIHVPNDAIASHQSVRLLLHKSQPSWESSKCWRYLCTPIFPEFKKFNLPLRRNPSLENPCFQSGNHVMVRLILKNISKTVSQCIPCIPHALLRPCSKAGLDTSKNLQKDQGSKL